MQYISSESLLSKSHFLSFNGKKLTFSLFIYKQHAQNAKCNLYILSTFVLF